MTEFATDATALSIVLTGGATGIGAATVARLEAQGHSVTVLDIVQPTAEAKVLAIATGNQGDGDVAAKMN